MDGRNESGNVLRGWRDQIPQWGRPPKKNAGERRSMSSSKKGGEKAPPSRSPSILTLTHPCVCACSCSRSLAQPTPTRGRSRRHPLLELLLPNLPATLFRPSLPRSLQTRDGGFSSLVPPQAPALNRRHSHDFALTFVHVHACAACP